MSILPPGERRTTVGGLDPTVDPFEVIRQVGGEQFVEEIKVEVDRFRARAWRAAEKNRCRFLRIERRRVRGRKPLTAADAYSHGSRVLARLGLDGIKPKGGRIVLDDRRELLVAHVFGGWILDRYKRSDVCCRWLADLLKRTVAAADEGQVQRAEQIVDGTFDNELLAAAVLAHRTAYYPRSVGR